MVSPPAQQYALQDVNLQLASLKLPRHCPPGVYLVQDQFEPLTLHGIVTPQGNGPYSGGVYRFIISWTGSLSLVGKSEDSDGGSKQKMVTFPHVTFQERVGHPLISTSDRLLSLFPRFPTWRPRVDTLPHLLYYIRDIFSVQALEDIKLREEWWTDHDTGRLLQTHRSTFDKVASQSASLSTSRQVLHADPPSGGDLWSSGITFPELTEEELQDLRREIFGRT